MSKIILLAAIFLNDIISCSGIKNFSSKSIFLSVVSSTVLGNDEEVCGKSFVPLELDPKDPNYGANGANAEIFQINNGVEARPHSWPWQASILRRSGSIWVHICGGTLISRRLVLTAAHCTVYSTNPKDYQVLLGAHDKSKAEASSLLYDVVNISIALGNDWNKQKWLYDFAIFTLSEDTRYTNAISPVCLEFEPDHHFGTFCYITGWGKSDTSEKTSNVLMQAGVYIWKNCTMKVTDDQVFDSNRMVCAGDETKDTCQGDSGGPLVCQETDLRWYLYGITSHGFQSTCGQRQPSIYTKISYYKSMIMAYLNATN